MVDRSAGRGLGARDVEDLNLWAVGGLRPDLTVLLDVDPQEGRNRRTAGNASEDRMESEPDDFHARIRGAFLEAADRDPARYLVLPAASPVDDLARRVLAAVRERLA